MRIEIKNVGPLRGELSVPADKSISHRAVILGSLASGETVIRNLSAGQDVQSSVKCMGQFGVEIISQQGVTLVRGNGIEGLREPEDVVDCGNSGTTMRLAAGVAASRRFQTILSGDESLRRRPMKRIIDPLRMMGAEVFGRQASRLAPMVIYGGSLKGINYRLPVASAQVKSAILIAGLGAEGETIVEEPLISRDHTERMLKAMGADLQRSGDKISVTGSKVLQPLDCSIPGDISSAAFWMAAAAMVPGSEILISGVGLNPTRCGIIDVLTAMGSQIKLENLRMEGDEPVGDIVVRYSELHPTEVGGSIIPLMIDEIPVLAMVMACTRGDSVVRDAGDLRAKESDRIAMIVASLKGLGVDVSEMEDGFVVHGQGGIPGGSVPLASGGDHRMAMSLAVAGMVSRAPVIIEGFESVAVSYPGFYDDFKKLAKQTG